MSFLFYKAKQPLQQAMNKVLFDSSTTTSSYKILNDKMIITFNKDKMAPQIIQLTIPSIQELNEENDIAKSN